jgi:hypothetical protein
MSFVILLRRMENPTTGPAPEEMHPFCRLRWRLLLKGSMSLDFRIAALPYSTAITDSLDSQVATAPLRIQFAGVTPVPLPTFRWKYRRRPGCEGFLQTGAPSFLKGAYQNPHGQRPCQTLESSRRNQITLSAPHRTVLAVFPHTALRIVLGYHICTRIRGFGI